MNAEDWQAAAEVLGVLLVVLNALGGLFLYRMQASFVTRGEHHAMSERIEIVENSVTTINQTISGLFTNEKAEKLYEKMGEVQRQNSQLLGALPGLQDSIKRLSHQTDLLIQNELSQAGKRP